MLLLMPLSAGGGYFSIGIAPDTAFKAYTVNEGKAAESPAKDYFRIGGNLDAAIGYSFNDWLGLGLSTGVNYGKTAFNYSQGVLTVPFRNCKCRESSRWNCRKVRSSFINEEYL